MHAELKRVKKDLCFYKSEYEKFHSANSAVVSSANHGHEGQLDLSMSGANSVADEYKRGTTSGGHVMYTHPHVSSLMGHAGGHDVKQLRY